MGIYGGEVRTIMLALFDICTELYRLLRLLVDDDGEEEEDQEGDF